MVVITVASRKGGSGKSTLTANLAAFADKASRRRLLIDADPQGSLSLWHGLRKSGEPPLRTAVRGVENLVGAARQAGFEWVFIDTPPQMSGIVIDAVRAATLVVIPARPSVFDLDAVKETIAYARERRSSTARRPSATARSRRSARRPATAWRCCVHRCGSARSPTAPPIPWRWPAARARASSMRTQAASEIARLFNSIERSVKAIQGEYKGVNVMHRRAA
jgi:chromosome partitioning protein